MFFLVPHQPDPTNFSCQCSTPSPARTGRTCFHFALFPQSLAARLPFGRAHDICRVATIPTLFLRCLSTWHMPPGPREVRGAVRICSWGSSWHRYPPATGACIVASTRSTVSATAFSDRIRSPPIRLTRLTALRTRSIPTGVCPCNLPYDVTMYLSRPLARHHPLRASPLPAVAPARRL